MKKQTKHQLKSDATRAALLEAAETIFARDGFEGSQIDEIAKLAGRTRGAVYAQFRTKEALFMALIEQRLEKVVYGIGDLLEQIKDEDFNGRLRAMKQFYSEVPITDAAMLDLEYKLYGLRHPESMNELRALYKRVPFEDFPKRFGVREEKGRPSIKSRLLAMNAITGAFVLAMHFQPDTLTKKEVRLLLLEVFEGFFPTKPEEASPKGKKTRTR